MFEMIPRGAVGGRSRRRAHLFAIHSTLTHSLNSLWIDFVQLIDTHTPIKSTGDLSLYKAATPAAGILCQSALIMRSKIGLHWPRALDPIDVSIDIDAW